MQAAREPGGLNSALFVKCCMSQSIYIRNMVCQRCIMAVGQVLGELGIEAADISLGEVSLAGSLEADRLPALDERLRQLGFERIDDRKARVIEKVKSKVISIVHHSPAVDLKINWSSLLADEANMEYHYLSGLFSSVEGITLEQYIIRQKIEKVKELLFYDELSLSQIADRLGYSSVAHLSGQFKKITGATPTSYKQARLGSGRRPLDSVGKA